MDIKKVPGVWELRRVPKGTHSCARCSRKYSSISRYFGLILNSPKDGLRKVQSQLANSAVLDVAFPHTSGTGSNDDGRNLSTSGWKSITSPMGQAGMLSAP
jgi:hypothetical protein